MTAIAANTPGFFASVPGYAQLTPDALLAPHADIMGRIKLCFGLDRTSFEEQVMALVRRYAAYVHLLPATDRQHFRQQGGLLRLGLETAFYSLQGTDAHIFSGRATISVRRELEPRWRHATFLAGLCGEVHRALGQVRVKDGAGRTWSPFLLPLSAWLEATAPDTHLLDWCPQAIEHRGLAAFALPHIVPATHLAYLAHTDRTILNHMLASISGTHLHGERNVLADLVHRSLALVIERHRNKHPIDDEAAHDSGHLLRYLLQAIQQLVAQDPRWAANAPRSRLWWGADGLFLLWPAGGEDIRQWLEQQQLVGMPDSTDAIRAILAQGRFIEAAGDDDALWTVQLPGSSSLTEAIKLNSADLAFAHLSKAPTPLEGSLVRIEPTAPAKPNDRLSESTPGQLPLLPTQPAAEAVQASLANGARSPAATAPKVRLESPQRLSPFVQEVLVGVVDSLNHPDGIARCRVLPQGVFVPVQEFKNHGLQLTMVLRTLLDARMLAAPASKAAPTATHAFRNQESVGVVIDPRFVKGLETLPPEKAGQTGA